MTLKIVPKDEPAIMYSFPNIQTNLHEFITIIVEAVCFCNYFAFTYCRNMQSCVIYYVNQFVFWGTNEKKLT